MGASKQQFTDEKVKLETYLANTPELLSPRLRSLRKKVLNETADEEQVKLYEQLWKHAVARAQKHRTKMRQARTLELRARGWTWRDIASDVGYATENGARAAYGRAIKDAIEVPAKEQRLIAIKRMETLIAELMEKLPQANNASSMTALSGAITQAQKHLSKITGIEAPTRHEVDIGEAREEVARFAKFVIPFVPEAMQVEFMEKFDDEFGGSDTNGSQE